MNLMDQLEIYISAQRGVVFNAFIFSAGMITVAILLNIYGTSQLAAGIRNGTFLTGIILIAMGVGLCVSQENILQEKKRLYYQDEIVFKQAEIERMTIVENNYAKAQVVMAGLVVISLVTFLLIKSPIWQGFSLSFAVFFVGNVIMEAFSYLSVASYFQYLTK